MFVVQSVGSDEFGMSSLEHKKSVGYKGFYDINRIAHQTELTSRSSASKDVNTE